MKYFKEMVIFGIGVIGGFVTCGVVVANLYATWNYKRRKQCERRSGRYPWGEDKEPDNIFSKVNDIIFNTREDAEKTINSMKEIVNKYGMATVSDLYDLSGFTANFIDTQYGWTDISGMNAISHISCGKYGYKIHFPKVSLLK